MFFVPAPQETLAGKKNENISVHIDAAQDKPRVFVQGKGSEDTQSAGSGVAGNHWGSLGIAVDD
jgi:hypothetical protein